jgi:uncharacterized protein
MAVIEPIGGQMVWHDLLTTDVDVALAFYTRLFGWTCKYVDRGRGTPYMVFRSGDGDVGGVIAVEAAPDVRSRWRPYVGVANLMLALDLAEETGGRAAQPPVTHPLGGRSALVLDPGGAEIAVLEQHRPSAAVRGFAARTGHFCWHELRSPAPSSACPFYRALAGWGVTSWDLGELGTHWVFRKGDRDIAGMVHTGGESGAPPAPARWVPYIQVVSVEDTAVLVEDLGGSVVLPPGDVPDRGRIAVVRDPAGAEFAIFALTEAA